MRAIDSKKVINYQARKWESIDSDNVENVIKNLTKIRFWDNRKWRQFPFYRDEGRIKDAIIDEYTRKVNRSSEDVSYYYSAVQNVDGRLLQMHESSYKQLKQPLSNGNNTLDYINDYIELNGILFKSNNDHRAIYSLRVSNARNVREDSVFKFVYDNQFVDNILEVFTPDELFLYLKKFGYSFDTANADENKSKGKHINTLRAYFKTISNIDSFKDKYNFTIPTYQRPYVWGDEQLKKLLDDFYKSFKSNPHSLYYISTFLTKEFGELAEVIDGQQRFTTLWLISFVISRNHPKTELANFLKKGNNLRLGFEIRHEVSDFLNDLLTEEKVVKKVYDQTFIESYPYLKNIAKALVFIKSYLEQLVPSDEIVAFSNFIYRNVYLIKNTTPDNTDLNPTIHNL